MQVDPETSPFPCDHVVQTVSRFVEVAKVVLQLASFSRRDFSETRPNSDRCCSAKSEGQVMSTSPIWVAPQ